MANYGRCTGIQKGRCHMGPYKRDGGPQTGLNGSDTDIGTDETTMKTLNMVRTVKLIAEMEIEIDGDISIQTVIEIMSQRVPEGAVSEDYDGTEDWAILVNKWSVKEAILRDFKLIQRLSKYPVRTCRTMHECCLCVKGIKCGEIYHDGRRGKRAHPECIYRESILR